MDLLLPVGPRPFDRAEPDRIRAVVEEGLAGGLWVRDLPRVPSGDADTGQGGDPFAHLSHLVGAGLGEGISTLGTASVILGLRHPLVVARAVAGLSFHTPARLVLGVGSGGKPAMNVALGVANRSLEEFARQWRDLREALHHPDGPETSFVVPEGYRAPELHLATTDVRRWAAIEGLAEGWQTFLTRPEDYLSTRDRILSVRGGQLRVCVRADIDLGGPADSRGAMVGDRGRVTCTVSQLVALLRTWLQLPVDHLLLSIRGADPLVALRALRDQL